MIELTERVSSGQEVTFLLDDSASPQLQSDVRGQGTAWLRGSILTLQRALDYSLKALVTPEKVAAQYWELLGFSFGLIGGSGASGAFRTEVNEIIAVLNKTLMGISKDLEIADISQMPLGARLKLKCMHPLSDPTKRLAGLVYAGDMEMLGKYVENTFSGAPKRVKKTELSGRIHLNFDELFKRTGRGAVVTLMHEATHKFAMTTDEQYFADDETPGSQFKDFMSRCQNPAQLQKYGTFQDLVVDAREMTVKVGGTGTAIRNIKAMRTKQALNNADSYAVFALDVGDLPTSEETNRAIARAMGSA